jgi:hypothetical protein
MDSVPPLRPIYEIAPIGRSPKEVEGLVYATHSSFWTANNKYSVPKLILDAIQALYRNGDNRED